MNVFQVISRMPGDAVLMHQARHVRRDDVFGAVTEMIVNLVDAHSRGDSQEAFLRLCRHLQEGRTLENPKAWLFTVANNLAIDSKRSDSNLSDLDEHTWKEIEESRAGTQIDPEKLLLQDERLDRLHVAVLNLTALQRDCLHLRAEGLRYREIAELMKISISTVADAVRRAAVKLAREVDTEASS